MLTLLKEEFPDVTISKIRFLESQGLLDPERTPSGYRKFYDSDVERLKWILRQQRENFLPLKVIKGRLRRTADGKTELAPEPQASAATAAAAQPAAAVSPVVPVPMPADEPAPLVVKPPGANYTLTELAASSGLEEDDLRDLERFGLLSGRKASGAVYYDEEALQVASLAAGFMKYGVEARHLRMYKVAGEREAGFFEQVVMPMLKQRNPQSRRQATEVLSDLSRLGQGLRQAMLRQALRSYIEGQ